MTAKRPEEAFDETPETPADSQQEESRSEATADAEPEAADDVADEGADTGLAELQAKGVNRVILSLPTSSQDESLKVLDSYAPKIEWARGLG